MTNFMKRAALAFVGACAMLATQPALANALTRDGFAFPSDGNVKIVVFRPDVHVGSLRVGGLDEPNADWTQAARGNIQHAMESAAEARNADMKFLGDYDGEQSKLIDDYRGLFEAVAGAVFVHAALPGNNLPTKLVQDPNPQARKHYKLDWTLGEGAARLREVTHGDYAMFVFTKDAYGDAGRKVAQLLMAGLFGAYIPAGVHVGYAGLVDLRTGDLVWFNTNFQMGGDPREADGATKRVAELLKGFPAREGAGRAAAAH